ncbi:MAG TPA: glycosyltransferase [Vicinamibacterales bacterium]|jgi:hypothetical protein|nr:glycosyltransferase [Vicinamibacterales bacterium]
MPSAFSVVALVAAYNEADIIHHVIADLIDQHIDVYFLDDGSTDDTVKIVEPFVGRGVLAIERLPARGMDSNVFDWERILRRKSALAAELDASWFIHHDADEFRESPWAHLSLHDAIRRVDALGFNAIDFAGLDFWPVDDRFRPGDDVRDALTCYTEFAPYDRVQIRCWKKTAHAVDLASSGGHEAKFPDRKVFPLRFLLRHYPIRGQAHAERKIFRERRNRFLEGERARGWHVQYDGTREGESFLREPASLTPYDANEVRLHLTLPPRDVEARAEQERLGARLEQRTAEFAALQAFSWHQRDELARLQEEAGAQSAYVKTLTAALAQATRDIERWRDSVTDLTRRLDELHRSFSWRCTSPARTVIRLLRGR